MLDTPPDPRPLDERYARAYVEVLLPVERADVFLAQRFEEGKRWRSVLDRAGAGDGLVLDIGAGSGAVALANAAGGRRVVTLDSVWNESARLSHLRAGATFRHVIGEAERLPFRDEAFEAIVCLETVEHFADAKAAGREASRVLRRNGQIVLITPARLAWIFRPDPHFHIRFLLLFPPRLQRAIAARRGFGQPHHFVDRIYTSARQVARLFPGTKIERVLTRSRMPKRWFWDALLLRKEIRNQKENQKPEEGSG